MTSADAATVVPELGPTSRRLAHRYFTPVRFTPEAETALRQLHKRGFVVHVMRTSAWVNYLYLVWALSVRALPPVRAVFNLRRWFTRPWRLAAQRGGLAVRFAYARRHQGSGLVFLKHTALARPHGLTPREDPFPALVELARRGDRPVYLVPELFVWERRNARLRPNVIDYIFGSPEAPGFLSTVLSFWRNHRRAQFRVGEPLDLTQFVQQRASETDAALARKVRSLLHHHLSRETRAVFGAPSKPVERLLEETLRDRNLRNQIEDEAKASKRSIQTVEREARRHLNAIAARPSATATGLASPLLRWVFGRIYDGIDVDEAGLERALKAAAQAPLVLCPSHKSHMDYLIISWVLWNRGYAVPLVAAGANLSFFPLGTVFRRVGAFFVRRTFRGDRLYTACFRAYLKKLVHERAHQEFFPEGGRSRTGKLLPPKLGMFTWEVDAVLDGAASDICFVPVAIDYEKIVEGGSYTRELAGGEKRPENIRSLLSAPKVLTARYGRIQLGFDEPISLRAFATYRAPTLEAHDETQRKGMVRALAHRVMHGISNASTVTPQALVAATLLSARQDDSLSSRALAERLLALKQHLERNGARLAPVLHHAPCDPTVMGPIQDALTRWSDDRWAVRFEKNGAVHFQAIAAARLNLAFYKNTLMNRVAPRALVASALLSEASTGDPSRVRARALFLSRLFKLEFAYRAGVRFDTLFQESFDALVSEGWVLPSDTSMSLAPELHARPMVLFFASLLRDALEAYALVAQRLHDYPSSGIDSRTLVKDALSQGAQQLAAREMFAQEALSKPLLENAIAYLNERKVLVSEGGRLRPGPAFESEGLPLRNAISESLRVH
ncbi:MAG: 1-acyl-sn-glycerol-3-phosphate acyltransferase [Myxococcaceae bacterium]